MFLYARRALRYSANGDDAMGTGHLECKVAIVRQCVEAGEGRSPKQCVIAALERCDGEEQFFASGVTWGPNITSSATEPLP